jgi:hypothetical protein
MVCVIHHRRRRLFIFSSYFAMRNKPLRRERCYQEDRNMPLCRERCYQEDRNKPHCRERCYREDGNKPLRRERCYREDRNEPLCRERCYLEGRMMPLRRERCYYEIRKRQLFVLYNKKTEDYGTENTDDELSGSTDQRPLELVRLPPKGRKNHDGVKGYG